MNGAPYIRVGTNYYKLVRIPTIAGSFNDIIVPWTLEAIRQDHGKSLIGTIKKYDSFTCIPSHTDFRQEYHGFYNLMHPCPIDRRKAPFPIPCVYWHISSEVNWTWGLIICNFFIPDLSRYCPSYAWFQRSVPRERPLFSNG